MKNHTQLWLRKQETRVRLTLEYEATSKVTHKLQIEYTTLQKKKMRLDGTSSTSSSTQEWLVLKLQADLHSKQPPLGVKRCVTVHTSAWAALNNIVNLPGLMDIENQELKQLQKKAKALTCSLQKLNTQIYDNGKQRMLLEEKKTMMEMDFLGRIKVSLLWCWCLLF